MNHRVHHLRDWDAARSARIIESHRAYFVTIARDKLGRDSPGVATASDVVQEALIAATHAEARGLGPASAAPDTEFLRWIRTILENKVHEIRRREQTRKRGGAIPHITLNPHLPCEDTTPSGRAIRDEEKARLEEALGTLSAEHRQLVTWSIKDGLSRREIGERLNVSPTYASRICKVAERRLRDAYRAARCDEESSL